MTACPSCKASNPDAAKFCNQCGTRLGATQTSTRASYTPRHLADKVLKARAAMQGERKRVTVLFADIKGSTRLAEQAGAEAWHDILDRFFSILSESVHRYEGTVNQYTGDGIMALFGAPIAHEDHAQRACFAALAMQAAVRQFADELRLKQGLNLTLRVGLNTGEVIVGSIGDDLRMDYTAQGHTVNLAARMEHICEPGRVYLTRNTAQLVEGYFSLRDLGESSVHGVDAPVRVFDLEGEGRLRTRLERQMARMGSRFIGREQEMALLHDALERARAGAGQVVAVIGNAGIGKSRLCHEFLETLQRAGIPVHRATGVPYASALPLYPLQTLLRSRLRLPERCAADEIRRLAAGTFLLADPANAAVLPAILEFLGVGDGTQRTPDQVMEQRDRMLTLLARWLPRAEGLQLLLIEDLHFADPATEEFLARLCKAVRETRTLVLLNYRPEYVSERLIPLLDEQVQVAALSNEQIRDLARVALGPDKSLAGVPERICARANGNPYYAEEAVQALIDEGHVEGEAGAYTLVRPIEQWRIPDTVHALISARIDRLPEEPRGLLHCAAVIGQEFRPRLLASLASVEPEGLETGLTVLEESGFVHQRDDAETSYRFCHPLVQEVAYQTQLESQRARAHARLAQALEPEHPAPPAEPTEIAVQIAHHWHCAGEWLKAGQWSLQAARYTGTHDVGRAGHLFKQAIECFDRAPDSLEAIRGRIGSRGGLLRMSQFIEIPPEALDRAFSEARAMAEKTGDFQLIAEVLFSAANEQLHRGDSEAAVALITEAVNKAIAVGAGAALVHRFRLAVLLVFNSAGFPREGIELVNSAAGTGWLSEAIGAENYMSRGFYGFMLALLGQLDEGRSHIVGSAAFADKGDRSSSWPHAFLVDVAWMSGEYGPAMAEARRAVELAETFGSPFFRALSTRALALAHWLEGRGAEILPLMEQGRAWVAPGGLAHQVEANYLAALSMIYLQAGREVEAAAAAVDAIDSARKGRSRVWEIPAWLAWLDLPVTEGRRARAAEGLARTEMLIDSSGAEGFRGRYWQVRERWSTDPAEVERCRKGALAAWSKMGATGHVRRFAQVI
ncbi:MAG TPA: adenylate/guanylate cyclase domain-containing protein [Verrucomicrobiae bacterium]|nr:adenylate/guanylate cyclase domain-containing protein [Verrucomicrobiae bacterium]